MPSESALAGTSVYLPAGPSVAVPSSVAPSYTRSVDPGSAVKTSVGWVSLVLAPPDSAPVTGPTSSVALTSTGASGSVVSSVKPDAIADVLLPLVSVRLVLAVHDPSIVSDAVGISWSMVNGPLPLAVPPARPADRRPGGRC